MDILWPALVILVGLPLLLAIGVPIGYALGLLGASILFFFEGGWGTLVLVGQKAYYGMTNFVFIALPLFIFMSSIISESGMGKELFEVASNWMRRLPGGLAISSVAGCAGFGAVSGSSSATAAAIGAVAVPEMTRRGYDRRLALGTVAAGGNLGTLIPPSIPLIVYGGITGTSIGHLFMGGVVPGVTLGVLYATYIAVVSSRREGYAPAAQSVPWKVRLLSLRRTWTLLVLVLFVLGGIYAGLVTPTEAAAIGVVVSLALAAFAYRHLTWAIFVHALRTTVRATALLGVILVGGMVLGYAVTKVGIGPAMLTFVSGLEVSRWFIMFMIGVLFLILGCFLNPSAMILLVVPLVFPLVEALGFDLIWFGIFVAMVTEIAHLTPPVGGNLFIIQGVTGAPFGEVVRGSIPFIAITAVMTALLCLMPELALWLPSTMG